MDSVAPQVRGWFPRRLHTHPLAVEFADYLDQYCVFGWYEFDNGHGWDADIPPKEQ